MGTGGRLVGLPVTERGQSQEEKTQESAGGRQQGAGKTPCVRKSLLATANCFLDSPSVVCRGQQRKHHLGTY